MKEGNNIWVLENDLDCISMIKEALDFIYRTKYFRSLESFIKELNIIPPSNAHRPDLIIADLNLQDGYFTDFLKNVEDNNKKDFNLPFVIVSSNDNLDILRWCDHKGSLDFLIKPFRKNELLFKIEKSLQSLYKKNIFEHFKSLKIHFTQKEEMILRLLQEKNSPVSKEEIIKALWGDKNIHENNVNVHITKIRKKIAPTNYSIISIGKKGWLLEVKA